MLLVLCSNDFFTADTYWGYHFILYIIVVEKTAFAFHGTVPRNEQDEIPLTIYRNCISVCGILHIGASQSVVSSKCRYAVTWELSLWQKGKGNFEFPCWLYKMYDKNPLWIGKDTISEIFMFIYLCSFEIDSDLISIALNCISFYCYTHRKWSWWILWSELWLSARWKVNVPAIPHCSTLGTIVQQLMF